jgi:hypothetical protein
MPLPDRQPNNRTSATSLPTARGIEALYLDGGDTRGTETTRQPGGPTTHDGIRVGVRSEHLTDRQEEEEDRNSLTCRRWLCPFF